MSLADKLTTIAENMPKVYEAGKDKILSDMWETIQQGGDRTDYEYAFRRWKLSKDIFKPKYDIRPTGSCRYLFQYTEGEPLDLIEIEKECGIVFDFSGATTLAGLLQHAMVSTINIIDGGNSLSINYIFSPSRVTYYNVIKRINKLIVNASTTYTNSFDKAYGIEHCVFEGVIGQSGLDTSACTLLDKESIISVINTLSAETNSLSVTLSKTAVDKAFETSEGANNGSTSTEWTTLIGTKSNWTISLA